MLQLILNELKTVNTRLDGLEVGQQKIETRLDSLETGQQELRADIKNLDKRMTENAKDTAEMFHMQTDYLTAQFKNEIARIEIRIEHELFDKIQSLYEGYKMIREHLNIA